jgi:hypothetical protein
MGAVLGLHDSAVHVVEGGGLVVVNALVLVVSHAPLVWTADVINCMFDLCNRIDEDYSVFGTPQAISTSSSYYSVCVDVSTASSSLDHSSSPGSGGQP